MFEVIISSVRTGRVRRKVFGTHQEADRYIDRFRDGGPRRRSPRDFRVEVEYRPGPAPTQARSASEGSMSAALSLSPAA
jgi:hypothetical protein